MSNITRVVFSIEEDIRLGVLSFRKIAEKHHVPFSFVDTVWEQMCENEMGDE
jgi:hypothetical protein